MPVKKEVPEKERCQCTKSGGGTWFHDTECTNKAKHVVIARKGSNYQSTPLGEPTEIRLCGVHKRQADTQGKISVVSSRGEGTFGRGIIGVSYLTSLSSEELHRKKVNAAKEELVKANQRLSFIRTQEAIAMLPQVRKFIRQPFVTGMSIMSEEYVTLRSIECGLDAIEDAEDTVEKAREALELVESEGEHDNIGI